MPTHYIAVIEKEPDSAFGVWFPDVEGCFSAGETVEEAVANAAAALRQHVEAIESAGRTVPAGALLSMRSCATRMLPHPLEAGAVMFAVPLLADAGRTVRINISLDKALVDLIDSAATARGLTRSAFLAQAASEKIGS